MKTATLTSVKQLLRLAVVGLALAPAWVGASTVPDPQPGEIYLGVRSAAGEDSYLVKIGTYTQLSNSRTFDLGNLGADLVERYGSNWHSRDDLFWGIFGRTGSIVTTLYASKARPDAATRSAPWPVLSSQARNATGSQITSVLESLGGYRGRTATANSPVATFQPNTSESSSYHKQVATPGTSDFGSLSQWSSIEAGFAQGAEAALLDLYRLGPDGVGYAGYFSISAAGAVSFFAEGGGDPVPTVAASGTLGSFSALFGAASSAQTFTVSGANLTGVLRVTAPAGYEVSLNGTTFASAVELTPVTGTVAATPVQIRLAAGAPGGSVSGPVVVSSANAPNASLAASGTVLQPNLTITGTLSAFVSSEGRASTSQSFNVSGTNLTAAVTLTAPTGYELSVNGTTFAGTVTLNPTATNLASTPVQIRLSASAALGSAAGSITAASPNATSRSLAVTGTVNPATGLVISGTPAPFTSWLGRASATQAFSVSGSGLTAPVTITAPAGYQVSANGTAFAPTVTLRPTGGSLTASTVFVRLSQTAPVGSVAGNVTVASRGVDPRTTGVSGTVVPVVVAGPGGTAVRPNVAALADNAPVSLTVAPRPGFILQQWLKNGSPLVPPATGTTLRTNFSASDFLSYQAVFIANPFPAVVDSYHGLVGEGTVGAGFLAENGAVRINTVATGNFTGSLFYQGAAVNFSGKFDGLKQARVTIARRGLSSLVLDLNFDTAVPNHKITGTLTDGARVLSVSALPRVFTGRPGSIHPKAGLRYTVALPSPDAKLGHGFGLLSVLPNGTATFAGVLPDGVSFSTTLSSTDGDRDGTPGVWIFPVGFTAYGARPGALLGELYLAKTEPATPAAVTGDLGWVRPAGLPNNPLFPAGLVAPVRPVGQRFAVQNGVSLLSGSANPAGFSLAFDPGAEALPEPLFQAGTWPANNRPQLTAPVANRITLAFAGPTARFSGVFRTTPSALRTVAYSGITFATPVTLPGTDITVRGVGLFPGGDRTGRVEIRP